MKGIELKINQKKIKAAVKQGGVHLIATNNTITGKEESNLYLLGAEMEGELQDKLDYWYKADLKVGDQFTFVIKEIKEDEVTPPIEMKERQKLPDDQLLERYQKLKNELEEKGVI